jgi:hypothetical protein
MADPIVIACPHCKHLLHLPEDYLGRVVSCLECKSPFRAPVRDGGALTEPVPMRKARGVPAKLFIPLVGLLVLGFSGVILNGYLYYITEKDPEAAKAFVKASLSNLFENEPPEATEWKEADGKGLKPSEEEAKRREAVREAFAAEQNRKVDQMLSQYQPNLGPPRIAGLVASGLTLLGGLAFLVHRGYWLAFLGCAAAVVNSPDLGCCFVGIIVAIWGVLALISDEGRRYFGRMA